MDELTDKVSRSINLPSLIGFNGKGVHPKHGSKTGQNLHVDNDKWYCHRCKAGGYVYDWVAIELGARCENAKEYRRNNFPAVLKYACDIAGIKYTRSEEETSILDILERTQKFYVKQLKNRPEYYDYIKQKWGFSKEEADKIGIGFAPPQYNHLEDVPLDKKIKSGLFYREGVPHIRNRITIPYRVHGQIRYFIGRQVKDTEDNMGKYIKLLSKNVERKFISKHMKEPVLKSDNVINSDYVIITEGIMDYYTLELQGYPVLSPVATSIKDKEINRIKRYIGRKQVYICNDSEESGAGLEGAIRITKSFPTAKIIELPRGELDKVDVNDYFKSNSRENFDQLIENAKNGYEYLVMKELSGIEPDKISKKQVIKMATSYIMINVDKKHDMYVIEADRNSSNDTIVYYDEGCYRPDYNYQWLREQISKYLSKNHMNRLDILKAEKNQIISEVIDKLNDQKQRVKLRNFPRYSYEDQNNLYINCKNGIVHIDKNTWKFTHMPHSNKFRFRTMVKANYNSEFEFDEYHNNGLYPQTVRDIIGETDIEYWMMEMAYLYVPSSFLQHITHIVGIGNTGKSTIIRPIEQMFEIVADTSLRLLIDNDYGTGTLYDIDLLSINEIDKNPTKGLEILKALGTMETMTLNPKYVKMKRNYPIKNKTIMRSNHYLRLTDSSEKRRIFLFRAMTKFKSKNIDPDRETKLIAEIDDIFNYVVRFMPQLYQNRIELKEMTVERYDAHYEIYGDPLRTFVSQYMKEADEDCKYPTKDICRYYNAFARKYSFDQVKYNPFAKMLVELARESIPPFYGIEQKERFYIDVAGGKARMTGWNSIDFRSLLFEHYPDLKDVETTDKTRKNISQKMKRPNVKKNELDKYFN